MVAGAAVDSVSKERIVAAARRRFETYGYRRTSIAEIARDAGIAVGTDLPVLRGQGSRLPRRRRGPEQRLARRVATRARRTGHRDRAAAAPRRREHPLRRRERAHHRHRHARHRHRVRAAARARPRRDAAPERRDDRRRGPRRHPRGHLPRRRSRTRRLRALHGRRHPLACSTTTRTPSSCRSSKPIVYQGLLPR